MPRIRSIKPEFFTDDHVTRLSHTARLLYISMWCQADDRGRLDDAPKRVCGNAFGDSERVNPSRLMAELAGGVEPRILRYEVHGKRYIAIRHFRIHQQINRPGESRLPPPQLSEETRPFQGWTTDEAVPHQGTLTEISLTPHGALTEPSPPDLGSRNGDLGTRSPSGSPAPSDRKDEVFEAIVQACEYPYPDITADERGRVNQAAKQLREVHATPDDIQFFALCWSDHYPGATLTPQAITGNWSDFKSGKLLTKGRR